MYLHALVDDIVTVVNEICGQNLDCNSIFVFISSATSNKILMKKKSALIDSIAREDINKRHISGYYIKI